jgi:hypothetical protein
MLRSLAIGCTKNTTSRREIGPTLRSRRTLRTTSALQSKYEDVYKLSLQKPQEFWAKAAEGIDWFVGRPRSLNFSIKISIFGRLYCGVQNFVLILGE